MEPGCVGKSNTNSLSARTDLTQNPDGENTLVFKDASQKSARVVPRGIVIESVPHEADF